MAKPLAPGLVYPDPNEKRANKHYWDGEEWPTAPPPAPPAGRKKPRIWPWVGVAVRFMTGWVAGVQRLVTDRRVEQAGCRRR